jgi:nitrogen-specific signal transduction histidine kinase
MKLSNHVWVEYAGLDLVKIELAGEKVPMSTEVTGFPQDEPVGGVKTLNFNAMTGRNEVNRPVIRSEEEYRKLSYMFPEYLFLNNDLSICMAGRNIEELLNYDYGVLRGKNVNVLSDEDDLKSSLMIQIAENFFEWRSYGLKASDALTVPVEICGFRMRYTQHAISPIAMRVRRSRNHLEQPVDPEIDKLTYWIAHNIRGPLATVQGLINLAKIQKDDSEIGVYLNYMEEHAQLLDEKIKLMMRLASKIRK